MHSINLVWISQKTLIPETKVDIVKEWADFNPEAEVNVWYAESLLTLEQNLEYQEYHPRSNVNFLNIEEFSGNVIYKDILDQLASIRTPDLGYLVDLTKILAAVHFLSEDYPIYIYLQTDFNLAPYDLNLLDDISIGFRSYWTSSITPENKIILMDQSTNDRNIEIVNSMMVIHENIIEREDYLNKGTDVLFFEHYHNVMLDYKKSIEPLFTKPTNSKVSVSGLVPLKEYRRREGDIRTWAKI